MSLREWLKSSGRTVPWLAVEMCLSKQAIYAWLRGTKSPRAQHLIQIEKLTAGRVTASTLHGDGGAR